MALNTCEMRFLGIEIAFFQKITKNCPAAEALPPHPHRPQAQSVIRPPPGPVCDTSEIHYFTQLVS